MLPRKLLIGLTLVLTLSGCSGDYKFGLRELDYPEYFGPTSGNLNNVMKFNAEYSWLTRLPVGSSSVEAEHGTLASEEDVRRVGLQPGRYLFFSLNIRDSSVRRIWVSHMYDETPLEPAGTFLFRSSRLADGALDASRPSWEVTTYAGEVLKEQHPFGYVKLYRLPASVSGTTFRNSLHEQITIEVEKDGSVAAQQFSLIAHWHKASTAWWRLMTIT